MHSFSEAYVGTTQSNRASTSILGEALFGCIYSILKIQLHERV